MNVVNILNGATWLFQLAGLGAITSLGHLQTCVTWRKWKILVCFSQIRACPNIGDAQTSKVFNLVWKVLDHYSIFFIPERSCEGFFPKNCCQIQLFTSYNYITSPTSFTSPTSPTSNYILYISNYILYITYIIYINFIYITYIIYIYLHQLHLQVLNLYISPTKTSMSFAQEFLHRSLYRSRYTGLFTRESLHRSSHTGVLTQKLLHRSCYTGVVTQELLHGSCYTGVVRQEFLHRS